MKNLKLVSEASKRCLSFFVLLLVACGTYDLTDTSQTAVSTGVNQADVTVKSIASCGMVEINSSVTVICDGVVVGSLTNGKDGADGKDGVGCSLDPLNDSLGYSVTCGDQSGLILNGKNGVDGKDGADGTPCSSTAIPGGSGIYVICGSSAVALLNGRDGADGLDGVSCRAFEVEGGFDLYCGDGYVGSVKNGVNGTDGKDGSNGVDGTNCNAVSFASGDSSGYRLYCADSLVGVILNGVNGINGVDGKDGVNGVDGVNGTDGRDGVDGKDGVGCGIIAATDSSVTIACGGDTSEVKAVVNISNTYNNGRLEQVTYDPVVVYASSSSANVSSSASVLIVESSSSYSYSMRDSLIGDCKIFGEESSYNNYWESVYDENGQFLRVESGYEKVVNRGDSVSWSFRSSSQNDIQSVLNSVFEWTFEGASVTQYSAQGLSGLTTVPMAYPETGTYKASLKINGISYACNDRVRVAPAPITGCKCVQDEDRSDENGVSWALMGCSSYAPIVSYTWEGVSRTSEDGMSAFTPMDARNETRVTLKNSDSMTAEVYCGLAGSKTVEYRLNSSGRYFSTQYTLGVGTHYLTYNCGGTRNDDDIRFIPVSGGTGSWLVANGNSGVITESHWVSDSKFGSTKSQFVVSVESGEIKVSCDACHSGSTCSP